MYMQMKKLVVVSLPLILSAVLLSACGGASSDAESTTTPPSSTANKPDVSSIAVSSSAPASTASSVTTSIPSQTTTSAAPSSASSEESSSTESYSRVSRASVSSSPEDTNASRDDIPPTSTTLQLYRLSETSITLTWGHSSDNLVVAGYELERNGTVIALLEFPTIAFTDNKLAPYTDYTYSIRALDLAGNPSARSAPLTVRTLANPNSAISSSSKSSIAAISSASSKSSTTSASNTSSSKISSTPGISSISSSAVSSNMHSSSSLSISSKNSSSASSTKTITLSWSHPDKRENGQFLELDEIGGYELRFKTNIDDKYVYFRLNGNKITSYSTNLIPNNSDIQIAVFDTNELFSDFVSITPAD